MFLCSMQGGSLLAFPDVCKVPAPPGPPVPTPFPNTAMPQMASGAASKVLVCGMPALTTGSSIPSSNGDEAGTAGGVTSGNIMGKASFVKGSTKVMLQGKPAVSLGATTQQNGTNASGSVLAPSQTKVMVMS
jgi:uncharacterized Zn-binding protein involved in type VI secretion